MREALAGCSVIRFNRYGIRIEIRVDVTISAPGAVPMRGAPATAVV